MKNIIKVWIVICFAFWSFVAEAQTKLRVGVLYFYPPFVFTSQSGYYHGFDIELAKAICQQLNATCTFSAMSLPQMFASVQHGQVDAIMGAISITPDRKKVMDFTRSYLKSTMSYVTLANKNIDPNNLQANRIGTLAASTFYKYLVDKYGNTIKLVRYNTNEAMMNALSNKEIDIVLIDSPAATYWVKYSTGLFKTVGQPTYLSFDEGYGIAIKKGNTALLNSLNNALNILIQNGTFAKIHQMYFAKPLQK